MAEGAINIPLVADRAIRTLEQMEKHLKLTSAAVVSMETKINKLEKSLKREASATDRATRAMGLYRRATVAANRAVSRMTAIIKRLAFAFGIATVAVAALTVKLAVDFEQAMVKIETLVGFFLIVLKNLLFRLDVYQ